MGHAIGGGFLKATTKEAAMREGYADACEYAEINVDRQEDPFGSYDNSFKFYDKVFDTEDDAKEFFDSLGSYVDGVCMVKQASKSASNKLEKAKQKAREKRLAIKEKAIENFINRTSASVGCKKCGNRISSDDALRYKLICPKCRNWMVPDSVKEKYKQIDKIEELAEEQYKKDCAETGKPRYWAKYEVHC